MPEGGGKGFTRRNGETTGKKNKIKKRGKVGKKRIRKKKEAEAA